MDNFLSTKFLLSLLILVMFFVLAVMQLLPIDKFLEWASIIYGTFVTGNVLSKFAGKK